VREQGRQAVADAGMPAVLVAAAEAGGYRGRLGVCREAIVGLQEEGQACFRDFDCVQGDAGPVAWTAASTARSAWASAGPSGRGRRVPGQHGHHDPPGLPGGAGMCGRRVRAAAGEGGPCDNHACPQPLVCVAKVCQARRGEDGGCGKDFECERPFYCDPVAHRCAPRLGVGQACLEDRDCQPCLGCAWPGDGGPSSCQVYADVDQNCTFATCKPGLFCLYGACSPLSHSGEGCLSLGASDPILRGSCLDLEEACVGNPPTCQPRAAPGQPCVSDPGLVATQGSCRRTGIFPGAWIQDYQQESVTSSGEVCVRPSGA